MNASQGEAFQLVNMLMANLDVSVDARNHFLADMCGYIALTLTILSSVSRQKDENVNFF